MVCYWLDLKHTIALKGRKFSMPNILASGGSMWAANGKGARSHSTCCSYPAKLALPALPAASAFFPTPYSI